MTRLIAQLNCLTAIAVVVAGTGCGLKREISTEPAAGLPSVQVRVQPAEDKAHVVTEEVVGTIRAKLRATLEARLSGRIEAMPIALGDTVRKGQLLAQLDAAEIGARLEQAEASLEQAELEWKRVSTLFQQQSVTRSEYDSAQTRVRAAKGTVAEAKAMTSYVEITAPFNGQVAKKWAEVGDLAAPGKPLVDLEDATALQLEADVPEGIGWHIQQDSQLAVRVDGMSNELSGVVREIAPSVDPMSRTFRIKLDLPQTEGLKSGRFARLAVPIAEKKCLRVPTTAVVQRGQLEIVFSVTNQQARLRLVRTGKRLGEETEILAGLSAGEAVVISGADNLVDGQPVEFK